LSDKSFEQSLLNHQRATCTKTQDTNLFDDDSICSSDLGVDALDAVAAAATSASAEKDLKNKDQASFMSLRITYLIVTLVIMLADGLQGEANLMA
jgi:hypothetical protein